MTNLINIISLLLATTALCSGSAIPMWEFLGRTEKMSHLYSMFAKEVSKYCKQNADTTRVTKCKHDLLEFGVGKLEKMEESHLDTMDPYQRSANDIIWESIMDGHPMMQSKKQRTTPAPIRQPTGLFERNPLFDGMDDEPSSDTKRAQDDHSAEMDAAYGTSSTLFAFQTNAAENEFIEPSNVIPQASNVEIQFEVPAVNAPTSNYLIGPMVVRVRPDGSPVEEDQYKPLPRDDDLEAMTIGTGFFPSSVPPTVSDRLQPPRKQSSYTNYRTITRRHQ